jgi:hypothetical protein
VLAFAPPEISPKFGREPVASVAPVAVRNVALSLKVMIVALAWIVNTNTINVKISNRYGILYFIVNLP